jgi:hypothetical protein
MAFLKRRLTRWMIMLVAVPLASWALAEVADRVAARRGESTVTRALRVPARLRQQRSAA